MGNKTTTNLTESNHIKIPSGLDIRINAYRNQQRIVTKNHAIVSLIKVGLDFYDVCLTGKYVDPFEIQPVDPRLVSFVDTLSKEDKERLFYHMLAKLPPQELRRIRDLAHVVD
jgi:hypothetical protein